jgi:hypothetical protein
MNFEGCGQVIAILKDDNEKDKKKWKEFYITDKPKDCVGEVFREVKLKDKPNLHFQPIPDKQKERSITYVTGASGSGKSYWTRMYVDEYKRLYPKREVYLISSITDDTSIDKIKGLRRIKLEGDFLTNDVSAEDFKDSCLIFDDTDCITNKPVKLKVQKLMDECLQIGRHFNITCLITSHALCAGSATKMILNEAHTITIFPSCAGKRILDYLCVDYLGLSKQQISKLKKMDGRSVTFVRNYPRCVFSDNECVILKEFS